jgi:hypothetical protein
MLDHVLTKYIVKLIVVERKRSSRVEVQNIG